jgi:hypothetical protein
MRVLGGDAPQIYAVPEVGDFGKAVEKYNESWQGPLVWGDSAPLPLPLVEQNAPAIRKAWLRIMWEYPTAYLSMKLRIWAKLSGLDESPRTGSEMIRTPVSRMDFLGPRTRQALAPPDTLTCRAGRAVIEWELGTWRNRLFGWMFRQWATAGLGLAAALVLRLRLGSNAGLLVWLAGVLAYGCYFLLTPSTVFRYFFASYACFAALVVAAVASSALRGRQNGENRVADGGLLGHKSRFIV